VSVEQIGYVGDHYESLSLVGQLIFFWVGTRITAVANSFRSPIGFRGMADKGDPWLGRRGREGLLTSGCRPPDSRART